MDDDYIKILNSFNFNDFKSIQSIKDEFKQADHIEATQIIKNYGLATSWDYVRACGKNNFTDLPLKLLRSTVNEDSKFIISRPINGKVIYLYTDQLLDIVEKINWLETKGYFNTIKKSTSKIKGRFFEENILTIGKKSIEEFKFTLDNANINTIAARKYYYFNKNHLQIQGQTASLGKYFGYKTKYAANDKNKDINGIKFIDTVFMDELDLRYLRSSKSYKNIDDIDVIWNSDSKIYAFEIEYSGNWTNAINRLYTLSQASTKRVINIIISEKEKDYKVIKDTAFQDTFYHYSSKYLLAHITEQNLIHVLEKRLKVNTEQLKNDFEKSLRFITNENT